MDSLVLREAVWRLIPGSSSPKPPLTSSARSALRALPPFKNISNGVKCEHNRTWFDEWPGGYQIEICVDCGQSRTHADFSESCWRWLEPDNDIEAVRKEEAALLAFEGSAVTSNIDVRETTNQPVSWDLGGLNPEVNVTVQQAGKGIAIRLPGNVRDNAEIYIERAINCFSVCISPRGDRSPGMKLDIKDDGTLVTTHSRYCPPLATKPVLTVAQKVSMASAAVDTVYELAAGEGVQLSLNASLQNLLAGLMRFCGEREIKFEDEVEAASELFNKEERSKPKTTQHGNQNETENRKHQ